MNNKMDRQLRHAMLKPLVRRPPNSADDKAMIAAFKRIDSLALGTDLLNQLQEVLADYGKEKKRGQRDTLNLLTSQMVKQLIMFISCTEKPASARPAQQLNIWG